MIKWFIVWIARLLFRPIFKKKIVEIGEDKTIARFIEATRQPTLKIRWKAEWIDWALDEMRRP